jgi:hypothetical protein
VIASSRVLPNASAPCLRCMTADTGLKHGCEGSEVLFIFRPMRRREASQPKARQNRGFLRCPFETEIR